MSTLAKLAETKKRLSEKYARLAAVAGSKPKRRTFIYKSERYRRKAEQLAGQCKKAE